jgi:hypothetical protein
LQEIQRDRDELSQELEAKNITIQKLILENQALAGRFAAAQKEAEELIKFTKEFFEPTNLKQQPHNVVNFLFFEILGTRCFISIKRL